MTSLPIPSRREKAFVGTINHPELFLWDAWSLDLGNEIRLFSLAVSRTLAGGAALEPHKRNEYPFHVRQFKTLDLGASWTDEGVFQTPGSAFDGHDSRNIWSGSIFRMNGKVLVGYTGIREMGEQRPFLQSLAIGEADLEKGVKADRSRLLLCPLRDESLIRGAGYYLDERQRLGHVDGEYPGPILAWRDPFIFAGQQSGELFMVWAAKQSVTTPAMGLARMACTDSGFVIKELYPPIRLPDDYRYSQLEVPKIYADPVAGGYILVAATTTRLNEKQADAEVAKCIRMYRADQISGPWHPIAKTGSRIDGLGFLFGMTVLRFDADQRRMRCIAPVSEAAGSSLGLSFSRCFDLILPDATDGDRVRINWTA